MPFLFHLEEEEKKKLGKKKNENLKNKYITQCSILLFYYSLPSSKINTTWLMKHS